ncbi:hypothetical protein [Endozoicomonas sp.]|uniref:hypothetical protein n=1 Tax=Endozoicomonas sp. TaxID=1892382 RepID=UPI002886701A|nr:ribbon-helix-helix domain-containing protein [Endozoicomonas sp.]
MVKTPSKQVHNKKPVNAKAADALADSLADKPYGKSTDLINAQEEAIERLTIAMSVSLYDELEALAKKRKRAKAEHRSMSAIAREAISEYLKHNS